MPQGADDEQRYGKIVPLLWIRIPYQNRLMISTH
jgi:hypothetical protein